MLERIKAIEKSAYPSEMQMIQECNTLQDLAEYCECSTNNLRILCEENWYIICANHKRFVEIVDWASIGKANPFKAMEFIKTVAKGKRVKLDARETTSYPFVVLMARHNKIAILKDTTWEWGNDIMHEMEIVSKL